MEPQRHHHTSQIAENQQFKFAIDEISPFDRYRSFLHSVLAGLDWSPNSVRLRIHFTHACGIGIWVVDPRGLV